MSKEKRRVPKLRFPGFTEDWEQRKLDDIAKIKTGGGTPKTANPEYWSGNIPWIQSSDLVEGDIVHVNINKFINNNALKNSAAKLISRDSIALVTRVGVGKVAVINQDFTTSQDFLSLSDFDGNDIKFLAYQLYRLMQENAKVLQGTSIKGITKTELIEQSISIPSSGQEQNLISNVLSKIDSIITLHQRKLDNLKLKKKALLQKLFPKNGDRYPELRFPGFTDAWEQRKLGEYANFRRGSFPQPYGNKEWYDGVDSAPFVQVVDVGDNLSLVDCTKQRISKLAQPMSVYAEKGSVLVTLQGSIGRVAVSQYDAFIDRTILIFQGYKYKTNPYFWAYIIKGKFSEEALKAPGGTIKTITKEALSNFIILYPKFSEQEQIGSFFEKLDKLITLHQ